MRLPAATGTQPSSSLCSPARRSRTIWKQTAIMAGDAVLSSSSFKMPRGPWRPFTGSSAGHSHFMPAPGFFLRLRLGRRKVAQRLSPPEGYPMAIYQSMQRVRFSSADGYRKFQVLFADVRRHLKPLPGFLHLTWWVHPDDPTWFNEVSFWTSKEA